MIKEYKKGEHTILSTNFVSTEFDCKCGRHSCDITYIDTDLIDYLQGKRNQLGKPFHVNSGFRCTYHNRDVGGKKGSLHLTGKAADIKISGEDPKYLSKEVFFDADGLGTYNTFNHVDVRGYKARWGLKV